MNKDSGSYLIEFPFSLILDKYIYVCICFCMSLYVYINMHVKKKNSCSGVFENMYINTHHGLDSWTEQTLCFPACAAGDSLKVRIGSYFELLPLLSIKCRYSGMLKIVCVCAKVFSAI